MICFKPLCPPSLPSGRKRNSKFNAWLANEEGMADWVRKNVLIEKIAEADAENDRTKAAVQAKNAVRKAFEKRLRQVVAEYLYKVQ